MSHPIKNTTEPITPEVIELSKSNVLELKNIRITRPLPEMCSTRTVFEFKNGELTSTNMDEYFSESVKKEFRIIGWILLLIATLCSPILGIGLGLGYFVGFVSNSEKFKYIIKNETTYRNFKTFDICTFFDK